MMNDNESYRTAYVYVKGIFAGEIRETDEGYIFNYDKAYLSNEKNPAVSLTMPKREEKYICKKDSGSRCKRDSAGRKSGGCHAVYASDRNDCTGRSGCPYEPLSDGTIPGTD